MTSPTKGSLPFVILHHTNIPTPHFDLLLDPGNNQPLLTWRLPTHPNTWHTSPPLATRQPDHRRLYLTYEGPISNNRGTVTRLTTGPATLLSSTPTHLTLQLHLHNTPFTLTLPTALSNLKSQI